MIRLLQAFVFLLLLTACGSRTETPPLSGILWGGEGNRIILQSVSDSLLVNDTLLINHVGEFQWRPDTVIPGLYKLSKYTGQSAIVVLDGIEPVVLDGQYFNFPELLSVNGPVPSDGFLHIDKLAVSWRQALESEIVATVDSNWIPNRARVALLHHKLDSIDQNYHALVFPQNGHPLSQMYALLQTAGNRHLYHLIADSVLFVSVTHALQPYSYLTEVKHFLRKTENLKKVLYSRQRLVPGALFPDLPINDSLNFSDLRGQMAYLEISDASRQKGPSFISNRNDSLVSVRILFDTISALSPKGWDYSSWKIKENDRVRMTNDLGLIQLPSNFVIDTSGVIIARDVWNSQLGAVLEQLVKK
ncbi:hypothetical protein ACT3CD_01070 [Geofilum sp. OHC36d9]|uniref:hypothetical protein n=1 Tax=Geofilum sp. OHC36d9 TaxID=3458413 RepID=UPI0040348646